MKKAKMKVFSYNDNEDVSSGHIDFTYEKNGLKNIVFLKIVFLDPMKVIFENREELEEFVSALQSAEVEYMDKGRMY